MFYERTDRKCRKILSMKVVYLIETKRLIPNLTHLDAFQRVLNFRVRHSLQRKQRALELRDLDFRIPHPRLHCLDPFPGK